MERTQRQKEGGMSLEWAGEERNESTWTGDWTEEDRDGFGYVVAN